MAQKKFDFILTAKTAGWNYVTTARKSLNAFNNEVTKGNSLLADARTQVAALLGAYLGFDALRNTASIIKDANTAAFVLSSSLKAANREFDDIGSVESWGDTISTLSEKLRIYSRTDLQQAAARTIDMTKRLGFSADEMAVVIERTADLSAGKTDLVDAIERVTSAMRGEAEASEYLGLTLNEDYVKSWYEASGAIQGAWKDLTDLQKAQVRYQVFLEQSSPSVGKAADAVKTLGGAYALVKAQISDAINTNEDMTGVMQELSAYIAENADELGELAASITANVIAIGQWLIENREMVATFGKLALGVYAVTKAGGTLLSLFNGLRAAALAFSGTSLAAWLGKLRVAIAGVTATMGGMFATTMGVAGALAYAALQIGTQIHNYQEIKRLQAETAEIAKQNAKAQEELAQKFRDISAATGVTVTSMKQLDAAVAEGKIRFDESTGRWVAGYGRISTAAETSAQKQKQITGAALEQMKQLYQQYADQVIRLQDEIASRETGLADQLRSMARSGMDGVDAWEDLKAQADEYMKASKEALAAGDWEGAKENADRARELYAQLNTEVEKNGKVVMSQEQALKTAMNGVKEAGEAGIEALKGQKEEAREFMNYLTEESGWQNLAENMDSSKDKWFENWKKMQEKAVDEIRVVEDRIAKLVKDDHTVYINVKEVSSKSTGGLITIPGFSSGGTPNNLWKQFHRLSSPLITRGSGTKDDVPTMLKRWEFVQPPEAVRLYGLKFMEKVRRGLFPVSLARGFATGGTPAGEVALAGASGSRGSLSVTLNYHAAAGRSSSRADASAMADMVLKELSRRYGRSS